MTSDILRHLSFATYVQICMLLTSLYMLVDGRRRLNKVRREAKAALPVMLHVTADSSLAVDALATRLEIPRSEVIARCIALRDKLKSNPGVILAEAEADFLRAFEAAMRCDFTKGKLTV